MCASVRRCVYTCTHSCSSSSFNRKDRITGCLSLSVLLEYVKSLVVLSLANSMFINCSISLGSGRSHCPKHRVDTSSIKNALHESLIDNCFCLSSLERIEINWEIT